MLRLFYVLPASAHCLTTGCCLLQSLDLFPVPLSSGLDQVGWPAEHHISLEICFITTDRLAEPAVPVTGGSMLVCASVGETHGQVSLMGTGQNGRCRKREVGSGIASFGQITEATDKHFASKWLLWNKQSLSPSCLSSPCWQQRFHPPPQDWPQGSLIHTSVQKLMVWLQRPANASWY